jgi:3-hydroxyisobutyrate dehydrogenase-like beta-hydroxyacid dehydrogenase
MSENAAVAVLGTGVMGAAMARNLLAAGMEVRVWNRTREKADPLASDGATVAASPAEASEGAKFMVTMLSDTTAVEDAVGEGALSALAEAVAFARGIGVEPERFLETIEGGPLGLPYARIKGNMMIEDEFPTSFSLALARKDAGLVLEAADAQGLRLAITDAVAARFDEALEAGHGGEDLAAVYRVAEGDA